MKFGSVGRFVLAAAAWNLLSRTSLWVCDFDFREAIYWAEWEAALTRFWVVSALSSLLFAAALAGDRRFWALLLGTVAVCALAALAALGYDWVQSAAYPQLVADPPYRLFIATIPAARALRHAMNVALVLVLLRAAGVALLRWGAANRVA